MKYIWCLALLVFMAIGICTANIPNLMGNWTGSVNGYFEENGSYKLSEKGNISLIIVGQKDRLFTGNIAYTLNENEVVESFAGVIGLDNKTLYIAESNEGYDFGTVISDDDIELIYLEDGESGWSAIDTLHRIR